MGRDQDGPAALGVREGAPEEAAGGATGQKAHVEQAELERGEVEFALRCGEDVGRQAVLEANADYANRTSRESLVVEFTVAWKLTQ